MKEDEAPEKQVTLAQLEEYQNRLSQLYEQNINLRMKYPTEPMRFYQSEEEIDSILQEMQ